MKHILPVALGALLFTLAGCQTVPRDQVYSDDFRATYLTDVCKAEDVICDWDQISQVVSLRTDTKEATTLIDSNLVLIGEEQIQLDEPLRLKHGRIITTDEFRRKVIGELKKDAPTLVEKVQTVLVPKPKPVEPVITGNFRVRKLREVILDAGHGGKDPGAIGYAKSQEKDIVLDITNRLARMLEDNGIKVHMTRNDDTFISLQDRSAIASKTKADAFVSIHANASKQRGVSGVEVFSLRHLTPTEMNDIKRTKNRKIMMDHLAASRTDPNLDALVDEMMFAHKQGESFQLAQRIGEDMARSLKIRMRGTKTAGFYVLRNTLIPAVLVEVGFVTNPKEERLLQSSRYREKIARSIANTLIDYSKGK
ncbi:MAG: N-acetylmuramoyl-L-alanine amidase [Candidatus Omnitrophica bacterium]|nr:N-acetylmuramoyl-L-alanine amidase [Candidatus Omnitrophota bacterium]MCB9719514.1 N-acetylmuramoyl-L-alanine amidase [Candidatus Omnitrophota bacterium]